ncbi:class I SAM-dependent methyltransferase [Aggregatilinea lenta]|uniref:class I SAM-dependent methyltransferase n=1 Tax=Aggregatilinea lenta TaxID=913108 RepID=UPI000E5B9578|nr:class I SAM-dependent methyltransferase [Aggregatilinea lenta]
MALTDRQKWEARYGKAPRYPQEHEPNPLLMRWAPPALPGSRALELACGLGQDALWLGEHGYRVDAFDLSFTALRQARTEMQRRGISGVHFIQADLDDYPLPCRAYDLVYVYRFLDRRLFPAIRDRVRPGGLVIYETLNVRRRKRHPSASAAHTLELGELSGHFPGWQVLAASDDSTTSALVARKPESG